MKHPLLLNVFLLTHYCAVRSPAAEELQEMSSSPPNASLQHNSSSSLFLPLNELVSKDILDDVRGAVPDLEKASSPDGTHPLLGGGRHSIASSDKCPSLVQDGETASGQIYRREICGRGRYDYYYHYPRCEIGKKYKEDNVHFFLELLPNGTSSSGSSSADNETIKVHNDYLERMKKLVGFDIFRNGKDVKDLYTEEVVGVADQRGIGTKGRNKNNMDWNVGDGVVLMCRTTSSGTNMCQMDGTFTFHSYYCTGRLVIHGGGSVRTISGTKFRIPFGKISESDGDWKYANGLVSILVVFPPLAMPGRVTFSVDPYWYGSKRYVPPWIDPSPYNDAGTVRARKSGHI